MWDISIFSDEIYGPDRSFEDTLALMQKLGIKYTDPRIVDGVNILDMSDDDLDAMERTLAKYDVKVAALGTPLLKCTLRGHEGPEGWGSRHGFDVDVSYEEHLRLLPRAFEIADRFGVTSIRCFSFWREYDLDEVFDEVVEKLARAARKAGASGHALALENEFSNLADTGVRTARILKAVDSPYLTSIYDAGNSARRGGIPYPDDYEALKGLITHMHVKDEVVDIAFSWKHPDTPVTGRLQIGSKVVEVGAGLTFIPMTETVDTDYRALLTALREDGYEGFFTIENYYGGQNAAVNLQRSVEALRILIAEVWS
jgi:sugar phosphate isomerase/epimerase